MRMRRRRRGKRGKRQTGVLRKMMEKARAGGECPAKAVARRTDLVKELEDGGDAVVVGVEALHEGPAPHAPLRPRRVIGQKGLGRHPRLPRLTPVRHLMMKIRLMRRSRSAGDSLFARKKIFRRSSGNPTASEKILGFST
jgi:hypothetical protein